MVHMNRNGHGNFLLRMRRNGHHFISGLIFNPEFEIPMGDFLMDYELW